MRCAVAATLLALLAGCVVPPPAEPEPAPPPPPPPPVIVTVPVPPPPPLPPDPADVAARALIDWHERLRAMAPAELAREQQRLGEPAAPREAVELALLLTHRRNPGDLPRAMTLLEFAARDNGPWAAPARLLLPRLAEQRRLEDLAERQNQQLREQQRRIEQLGSQLEALRAIERSLSNRNPAAPAPGGAASAPPR